VLVSVPDGVLVSVPDGVLVSVPDGVLVSVPDGVLVCVPDGGVVQVIVWVVVWAAPTFGVALGLACATIGLMVANSSATAMPVTSIAALVMFLRFK
jgi:hypothetical protein